MKKSSPTNVFDIRTPIAGFLTWLLPGAGHIFLGDRIRGMIFMITIALTFWTGVAVGGVKNTVNPQDRSLWFLGQICAGGHTLTALCWSRQLENPSDDKKAELIAYGRSEEVSVVYTAICGMLNILIIFDVFSRAEKQTAPVSRRGSPP
ncbi:MAG: DUF6677 family protein [Planctomycetota bacterium]|jgi:hypothetical protein